MSFLLFNMCGVHCIQIQPDLYKNIQMKFTALDHCLVNLAVFFFVGEPLHLNNILTCFRITRTPFPGLVRFRLVTSAFINHQMCENES